jgi:hypothetical protein
MCSALPVADPYRIKSGDSDCELVILLAWGGGIVDAVVVCYYAMLCYAMLCYAMLCYAVVLAAKTGRCMYMLCCVLARAQS